ncbi:hypothetical protein Tco_1361812 [Tanacetum coccineum]
MRCYVEVGDGNNAEGFKLGLGVIVLRLHSLIGYESWWNMSRMQAWKEVVDKVFLVFLVEDETPFNRRLNSSLLMWEWLKEGVVTKQRVVYSGLKQVDSECKEEVRVTVLNTRPQCLIETGLESWQTTYTSVLLGKDNGEKYMKSSKEAPLHWERFSDVIAGGMRVEVHKLYDDLNTSVKTKEKTIHGYFFRFRSSFNDMRNINDDHAQMQLNSKLCEQHVTEWSWSSFITEGQTLISCMLT